MKTEEDEAFDDLARKQGMWGGGFQAKRAAAADKTQEPVLDLDGHVVGKARKPKGQQMPRDAEIARLNEKVEFLARTNMLYSDWEHRETQVTSELIRKGIEEAKINAELRTEIAQLKAQLAQPAQEPTIGKWYGAAEIDAMVRDLDIAMNGDAAAQQAKLCDLMPQLIERLTAQPAQEPVAWGFRSADGSIYDCISPESHDKCEGEYDVPLYTKPPELMQEIARLHDRIKDLENDVEFLLKPAQEPVALVIDGVLVKSELPKEYTGHLYTAAPKREWVEVECPLCGEMAVANTHPNLNKREWVGLTDGEIAVVLTGDASLALNLEDLSPSWIELVQKVESKLREKNNGT